MYFYMVNSLSMMSVTGHVKADSRKLTSQQRFVCQKLTGKCSSLDPTLWGSEEGSFGEGEVEMCCDFSESLSQRVGNFRARKAIKAVFY